MSRCIAKTPPFKAELASRAPQEFLRIEFLKAIKNQRFLRSKSPQTNPAFQGGVNGKGFLIDRGYLNALLYKWNNLKLDHFKFSEKLERFKNPLLYYLRYLNFSRH